MHERGDAYRVAAREESLNVFWCVSCGVCEFRKHLILCVIGDLFFEGKKKLANAVDARQDAEGGIRGAIQARTRVAARDVFTICSKYSLFTVIVVEHWIVIQVFNGMSAFDVD